MERYMSCMMDFRRASLVDAKEHDKAKYSGGQRVSHEQDQVVVASDQSRDDRGHRRAQIDRPIVISISARPSFGWNQIRNCRADRWSIKICKESNYKRTD